MSSPRFDIANRIENLGDREIAEVLEAPVVKRSKNDALEVLMFDSSSGETEEENRTNVWWEEAAGGLTIGDLIYDTSRIDPQVLEATDFARTADLSNVFEYSYFADRVSDRSADSYRGSVSNQQGYVAERHAAQQQQSMGKEVEIPDDPNQEGYDLLINGQKFQVKCHQDAAGVREHLEEYPDIPVLVNQELAEEMGGHPDVYPVPGLEYDKVVESTESTLEAGDEILDFEVPMVAVAVASGRNLKAIIEGKTDMNAALANVAFEVGGRTGGGIAGAKALAAAGLVLGPAGGVIGGLVGAILGAREGKKIARLMRQYVLCASERKKLKEALHRYLQSLQFETQKSLDVLERKRKSFEQSLDGKGRIRDALWGNFGWRIEQEQAYRQNKLQMIEESISNPEKLDSSGNDMLVATGEASRLMTQAGAHPWPLGGELEALEEASSELVEARERALV